jgi:hypothetical protein
MLSGIYPIVWNSFINCMQDSCAFVTSSPCCLNYYRKKRKLFVDNLQNTRELSGTFSGKYIFLPRAKLYIEFLSASASVHQCISASVHQCNSASVQQSINALALQCISDSVHQRFSESVQQYISATVYHCISAQVRQCISAAMYHGKCVTLHKYTSASVISVPVKQCISAARHQCNNTSVTTARLSSIVTRTT